MKPSRPVHLLLIAAALAAAACSTKSPTEPGSSSVPISPKPPPPVTTFNLTVTASPSHLTIGSTTGSKITVQAANAQDGTPPPNLTPVTLTTTLGEFNSVGSGTLSLNLQLVGGRAQAVLFPGSSAGTATVGATSPSSNGVVFTPGAASVSIGSPGTFFVNSLSPNTGDPAGGLVVTISGGGFLAPVGVTFGGSSAPIKSVSPNAIQVITPPSATAVPVGTTLQVSVTVTNNIGGTLGGSATLTNAFTYVPGGGGIQQPQVFSVNPASGTDDGGTQVTITGQGFVAPVQVFFGTGAAANFNGIEATIQSVTATKIIVISPPARGFGQDNTNQLVSILVKNTGSGFATIDSAAFKYGSKVIVTSLAPTTTEFNQQVKVTVFGQGFADPVAVSLAGIAAQVLSTSGTEIQVLSNVPAVSGCSNITGPVSVTNINNGDSGTGPTFTYLVSAPLVNGISPNQGFNNQSTGAVISGDFFEPLVDQVQIGSESASVNRSSSMSTSLVVTVPPLTAPLPTQPCTTGCPVGVSGTQSISVAEDVTVTDGTTSCTNTLKGAFTYMPTPAEAMCVCTPPAAPMAVFTVTVPSGSNQAFFTDTSTGSNLTYLWDFDDPGSGALDSSTVRNPPAHTYPPGEYQVTLTVTDNFGRSNQAVSPPFKIPGS
jgi:PKD domain/IPT/TIG domain